MWIGSCQGICRGDSTGPCTAESIMRCKARSWLFKVAPQIDRQQITWQKTTVKCYVAGVTWIVKLKTDYLVKLKNVRNWKLRSNRRVVFVQVWESVNNEFCFDWRMRNGLMVAASNCTVIWHIFHRNKINSLYDSIEMTKLPKRILPIKKKLNVFQRSKLRQSRW